MSAIRHERGSHARILEIAQAPEAPSPSPSPAPSLSPAAATACTLRWASEDDTARFAARLARAPGIGDAFIALHGGLGAGKTTLVRHLLRALGVDGRIKSPTYAVVEPHVAAGGLAVSHFDFYRFDDPREWEDAGFRDLFGAPGLKLAEWPEKVAPLLPAADLSITIAVDTGTNADVAADARIAVLTAGTARGQALLHAAEGDRRACREVMP